ncbi:Carnitine O-Palmitoyltransferase 2 [Manis pentadactyla]|nr:Carnitine O-Palmitoyltransferase 2 [Manis pentadactyla]
MRLCVDAFFLFGVFGKVVIRLESRSAAPGPSANETPKGRASDQVPRAVLRTFSCIELLSHLRSELISPLDDEVISPKSPSWECRSRSQYNKAVGLKVRRQGEAILTHAGHKLLHGGFVGLATTCAELGTVGTRRSLWLPLRSGRQGHWGKQRGCEGSRRNPVNEDGKIQSAYFQRFSF